ncbi:MAG: hypothetical protein QOI20_3248 [Acidimicrobiaceae bacterium]|jgi:hypothetical protein|nr:hypothetical protein [Acidimicrobiaceae bacterium]
MRRTRSEPVPNPFQERLEFPFVPEGNGFERNVFAGTSSEFGWNGFAERLEQCVMAGCDTPWYQGR